MTTVCAEVEGSAARGAGLVHQLRQDYPDLLIDQRGFLLIPESLWDEVRHLATQHECELRPVERSREAA